MTMTEQPPQQITFDFVAGTVSGPTLWPTGPTARVSDPDTSQEAGKRQGACTSELHAAVLRAIGTAWPTGFGGLTDDELTDQFTDRCPGTVKKRRTELAAAGLVRDSGTRRPTRTGSAAIVWVVA